MLLQLLCFIRNRWHPLWRLRQWPVFRNFQRRWDCAVYTRIPQTNLRVAVMLMRDASWIFNPGNLEPEIRAAFSLVLDQLKPATFWDIGANIGFYSWFVRGHACMKQVVMFEPDPTNFSLITRTIQKNAVSDCLAMNVALSSESGEASFLVDYASGATGSLETISQRDNESSLQHGYEMNETINCLTATIDEAIEQGAPVPDFMKIDVEGAEHLVLKGASKFLSRSRPAMIIETSNGELVDELLSIGYTAFRIDHENLLFVAAAPGLDLSRVNAVFPEVLAHR